MNRQTDYCTSRDILHSSCSNHVAVMEFIIMRHSETNHGQWEGRGTIATGSYPGRSNLSLEQRENRTLLEWWGFQTLSMEIPSWNSSTKWSMSFVLERKKAQNSKHNSIATKAAWWNPVAAIPIRIQTLKFLHAVYSGSYWKKLDIPAFVSVYKPVQLFWNESVLSLMGVFSFRASPASTTGDEG